MEGLLKGTMEEAARAIGHNPSWPLAEKRKLMWGMKKFFEHAVRQGPDRNMDLFQPKQILEDDLTLLMGSPEDEEEQEA